MKKWNKVLVSFLLMAMLTVQPAWAEEISRVVVAGQSGMQQEAAGPGQMADAGQVVESGQAAGAEQEAAGPGQMADAGQTAESGENGAASSGVLIVGAGMRQGEKAAQAEQQAENQAEELTEVQETGRQIDPNRPMVALTYDDGPQPSVGSRIMDCLAQYDGKATFFMVGDRVPSHAAEVQRMVAEGHEVANHSMNHRYLQKLGAAQIQAQVVPCSDVIQAVSGVRPTLMRLPGGNHNATVRANVNMPMIQWSIDTLDWKTRNADATIASVLSQVKDGDIILMHELYSQTADATERLVPELVNRGFQLVTVSEMAAAKGIVPEAGQIYSAFH